MAETKRRFEELTGARIAELYSLTEALVAPFANPSASAGKAGSVGLPAADVEVRVCDPETGEDLPSGEAGEVLLQAPQVMPGYWNDPEESAIALRDHGPRGRWLHTGDLGYLDDEGYLFLVDRMKDLIKPGGLQVWPREVEEALARHPAVLEAGVAGVPDPVKGEAVMAWVVARPGVPVTPDELRTHCKAHLAPYKVPARVQLRAELPKSLVGKVLRRALAAEARAEAAAADPPRT
jgi:long-chain acyl-CoA synthetase